MDLRMDTCVVPAAEAELVRYPDDEIWLRAVGHGDVQVVEYASTDRTGPPAHSHPWYEVELVLDGTVEFLVGGTWSAATTGAVQPLPPGAPHSVRVPGGRARLLMVTIGPPYDAFARDMARCLAAGAPVTELAAGRRLEVVILLSVIFKLAQIGRNDHQLGAKTARCGRILRRTGDLGPGHGLGGPGATLTIPCHSTTRVIKQAQVDVIRPRANAAVVQGDDGVGRGDPAQQHPPRHGRVLPRSGHGLDRARGKRGLARA